MKKSNKMITSKEEKVEKKEVKVNQKFFCPDDGVSIEAENTNGVEKELGKINSKK